MPDIKFVSQLPAVAEKSSGGVSVFLLIFEGMDGIVLLLWLDGNNYVSESDPYGYKLTYLRY